MHGSIRISGVLRGHPHVGAPKLRANCLAGRHAEACSGHTIMLICRTITDPTIPDPIPDPAPKPPRPEEPVPQPPSPEIPPHDPTSPNAPTPNPDLPPMPGTPPLKL